MSPGKPGNLTVADVSSASALLTWGASDGQGQPVSYLLYLNGIYLGSTINLSYQLLSLEGNTAYTVELYARSQVGNLSDVASSFFSTPVTAPNTPRNLRVIVNASRTVSIAWDAPLNFSPTGYRIVVLGKITSVVQTHHTLRNMPVGLSLPIGVQAQYAGSDSVWIYTWVVPQA
jgi:hypothetical protein